MKSPSLAFILAIGPAFPEASVEDDRNQRVLVATENLRSADQTSLDALRSEQRHLLAEGGRNSSHGKRGSGLC